MTTEKLKKLVERLEYNLEIGSDPCLLEEDQQAIIEALKKQIPKKPDYDGNLVYDTWICPSCREKYEVDYDEYEQCPKCGQALDWRDEV